MATEIRVPTLGESVSEATIGRWFKKPGEAVKADEPIVELETDKVTLEVNAPAAGVLGDIVAKEGETVGVNALLGSIGEGGASTKAEPKKAEAKPEPAKPEPAKPEPAKSEPAKPEPAKPEPAKAEARPESTPEASQDTPKAGTDMPPAPSAAKLMADNNVTLESGSGKRGQVLKGDVLEALAKSPPQAPAPSAPRTPSASGDASREERVKMTKLRQTIARRLKEAQNNAAMLTTFNEVDMSEVMALRAKYKEVFEKKHGAKLGFMGFFVKACVQALKEVPAVNAEIDGTDLVYKNFYHIGIAVGTDKGLVVPVVRDADATGIAGIEKAIADFGKRARDGQLKIDEMQGGTFTITNGGIYGSLMSTPILNAPQSGILGMHKIQERPMVVGGQVVVRPMMYLALSYDHRVVDGKEAVTFLVRVKEALEDPARLVLEL